MIRQLIYNTLKSTITAVSILGIVVAGAIGFETYIYDYVGSSVNMITKTSIKKRGGTGFQIISPSGKRYTLTNRHICKMGKELVVFHSNGSYKTLKVLHISKQHDLCLMEPLQDQRPLKIASNVDLHERIWLVGHPALRPLTLESGHFAGKVNIQLRVKCAEESTPYLLCTQTYFAHYINNIAYGGNSGSPVVNAFGNVVGVLFAGRPDQPTSSYMVPLAEIKKFLKDK